jgi:uncharacterized coiled-coil protein SlyX
MTECDREKETLETRIVELESELGIQVRANVQIREDLFLGRALIDDLESELAVATGTLDGLREDLAGAMEKLKEGRAYFADLYKRCFVDMDDYDAQLARMLDWALITPEED